MSEHQRLVGAMSVGSLISLIRAWVVDAAWVSAVIAHDNTGLKMFMVSLPLNIAKIDCCVVPTGEGDGGNTGTKQVCRRSIPETTIYLNDSSFK